MTAPTRRALLRRIAAMGSLSVFAILLTACGKKSDPKPPDPDKSDFPRKYPAKS